MKPSETILEELRTISPAVANLDNRNIFEVPEGYFSELSDNILLKIKAIGNGTPNAPENFQISSLNQIQNSNPFSVKEGYFDSLPREIMSRIRQAETANPVETEIFELSPLLAGIRNKQVFEVPRGYFENLSNDILGQTNVNRKARVIAIGSGKRSFLNIAAAACVVGVISIGAFLMFRNGNNIENNPNNSTVAKLNDSVIKGIMPQVSDEALANFLNNTIGSDEPALDNQPDDNSLALLDLDDNSVRDILKEASDNDIKDYLDENALGEGNALMTN